MTEVQNFYPEETKERKKKEKILQNNQEEKIKEAHLKNCNKWAKKYNDLGLNVIPIKYKSKKPNISTWKKFQKERIPQKTFDELTRNNKFENVAILGGHISKDIVCFDIDNPQDFIMLGLTTDQLIKDGAWVTETPREPGRYHIVIRDKEKLESNRLEKHIDYRANGCYWLAYPSIHPNNKQYNFLNTHDLNKLELPSKRDTLAIFKKWNDILNEKKETKKTIEKTVSTKEDFDNSPDCIRNAFKLGASPGMRYYVAEALGSYLQQQKFPLEMAQDVIINWFITKCDVTNRPIKDIKRGIKLSYKKKKYAMGCRFWRDKTSFCPYNKKNECKFYNPKLDHAIKITGDPQKSFSNHKEKQKEIKFSNGLLGEIERHINHRTNAPIQYATHMGINIIAHAVGVHCTHFIQPDEIHHNTYVALIGESTIARKTTVQNLMMQIACQIGQLPSSFSPEGLLKEMQENPQGLLPMGEFSTVLRGIRTGSYMANLKEILNELHGCPPIYQKRLSKMKDGVMIEDPYLCVSTTCTPEEFLANLTNELIYGGMIARFILVPGNATYRPRKKITKELREEKNDLRSVIWKINELFEHQNNLNDPYVHFEFTDDGLTEFNRIDKMLTENPKWENTKPFVGRYLDYIIVYADLLMLSDLIGTIGVSNFSNFSNISNISNFSNISIISKNDKKENKKKREKLEKLEKLVKLAHENVNFHLLKVPPEYVTQAFELLKPSLKYVCDIVRFVNEDMKVARVQSIFERHSPLSRSIAMKYCKLIKKDFDDAMITLKEREEIFELSIVHTDKQTRSLTVYCHSRCIDSNQCKKCKYKCEKNQRDPKI